MEYSVVFVDDGDLPPEHDWALVRTPREILVFIKESSRRPRVWEEIWAGYRRLVREDLACAM